MRARRFLKKIVEMYLPFLSCPVYEIRFEGIMFDGGGLREEKERKNGHDRLYNNEKVHARAHEYIIIYFLRICMRDVYTV